MILPLPEQFTIEREIHELFESHRDSIKTCARYLGKGDSNISRQINPNDPRRPNPFYSVMEILWALDCFCPELSDDLWAILQRERECWRVNCRNTKANSAALLQKIMDELKDIVFCDLTDATLEEKKVQTLQLRDAVDEKLGFINQLLGEKVGLITDSTQ